MMHLLSSSILFLPFLHFHVKALAVPQPASPDTKTSLHHRQDDKFPRPEFVCKPERKVLYNAWEFLGSGEFGSVYKTKLKGLGGDAGRFVAVKVANPGYDAISGNSLAQSRLYNEPGHTNIRDVCTQGANQMVVMEYIEGKDIEKRAREGHYKLEDILRKDFCAAIKGLVSMHRAGLAHNDVNSQNFIVANDADKKSAWIDYDATREATTSTKESDVSRLLSIAQDEMAGDLASNELLRLNEKTALNLEREVCSSRGIPLLKPKQRPEARGKTLGIGLEETYTCTLPNPMLGQTEEECRDRSSHWYFFSTDTGSDINDLCDESFDSVALDGRDFGGQTNFDMPSWPAGEITLFLEGRAYYYKCNGQNAGALFAYADEQYWKVGDCWGDLGQKDPLEKICETGGSSSAATFRRRRRVIGCDF